MSEILLGSRIYETMKPYIGQQIEEDIILTTIDELYMLQKSFKEVKDTIYIITKLIELYHGKPLHNINHYEVYYLKLVMEETSPKGVLRIPNTFLKKKIEQIIGIYLSSKPDRIGVKERGKILIFSKKFKKFIDEATQYVYNKHVNLETKLNFITEYKIIKWIRVHGGQIRFTKAVLGELPIEGVKNMREFAILMNGKQALYYFYKPKQEWGVSIPYGEFLKLMGEAHDYTSTILHACDIDEQTYQLFKKDVLNKKLSTRHIQYKYGLSHHYYKLLFMKVKKDMGLPLEYTRLKIFKKLFRRKPETPAIVLFNFEEDYLSKRYSAAELRRKYDFNESECKYHIHAVREKYGLQGEYLHKKRRKYSNDLKKKFILEWMKGDYESSDLMKKYNISRYTYMDWIGKKDKILEG